MTQAVLDLPALLRTLCYVDLNPVREKMAKSPESSRYTWVQRRLRKRKTGLLPFNGVHYGEITDVEAFMSGHSIPNSFKAHLELLEWTGRQVRKGIPVP